MKKLKKTALTLVSFLMICGLAAGCGNSETVEKEKENPKEALEDSGEVTTQNVVPEDIEIETEFGTLHFPEQWTEFVDVEQASDGETATAKFNAVINEKNYELFTIIIGNGDGVEIGELTDSEGKTRTVYAELVELETDDSLSEGEQSRLFAMQEDLNYVIEHLK